MAVSTKRYVTIDTWVLCRASEEPGVTSSNCQKLLKSVYDQCHGIVFDKPKNKILKEYKGRVRGFSAEWLLTILRNKNKTCKVNTSGCHVPRKVRKDRFDCKFIIACSLTKDKTLVTGDRGYETPTMRSFLKSLKILLLSVEEALENL